MARKKRGSHIGCLFWIALILLAVVIFVFNRSRFDSLLGHPAASAPVATKPAPRAPAVATPREAPSPGSSALAVRPAAPEGATAERKGRVDASGDRADGSGNREAPARETPSEGQFLSTLYFVRVGSDGTPALQAVRRRIASEDSPLTDTMSSLLAKLSPAEERSGLVTLIPSGTRLLDATVRGGTAYLDFNDRLRFNSFGIDGLRVEVKQVVFTATQFPTVQRVQILIGGQVERYLSPEGMAIDEPLTRSSFE